jgi:hypothetical protein
MAQNTIVVTVRLSIQPESVDDFVEVAQRLMVVPTQSVPSDTSCGRTWISLISSRSLRSGRASQHMRTIWRPTGSGP